ncbi:MAG: hypothetical protein D4R65_10775 [Verrucomicrobiaceae bacterium]|nr:MAG: hypothetical protein D4R65_10775 [Verrucomicrobiaceae bacterium]
MPFDRPMNTKTQDLPQRAQGSPRNRTAISSLCGRCGLGAISLFVIVFAAFSTDTHGAETAKKSSDLPEDLRRGLVLYYDVETKPVGDKITDLSGYKNDGKAVSVEWVADSQRGGAMKIGLRNSHITVTNNDSLNPSQLTLACWIKQLDSNNRQYIFDKRGNSGFMLRLYTFMINRHKIQADAMMADKAWHHIAATYDGKTQRMYVDGSPVGDVESWRGKPERNSDDLTIGQNITNAGKDGWSLFGLLDDVMMFNRALSAEEVQALFKLQGGVPATASSPLPAAVSTPTPEEKPAAPTPAERIKEIKQLLERGEIKQEEHDRRVKEILDAI